jgi:hypothetical protein
MSRTRIVVLCSALFLSACGARSEIAGSDDASLFDASLDDSSALHDATGADSPLGAPDASDGSATTCTTTSVDIGCAGYDPGNCAAYGCKFFVEWTCGSVSHSAGGACAPPDAGNSLAGTYQGGCSDNGTQTSTFDVSTLTCDCQDQDALATLLEGLCSHQ